MHCEIKSAGEKKHEDIVKKDSNEEGKDATLSRLYHAGSLVA